MRPECITAILQAAGRELTKAEIEGIETRMRASMSELARKDRAAFSTMPREERLRRAAEIAKANFHKDVAQAQANSIRNIAKQVEQLRKLESFEPGLHGQLAALGQRIWNQNHFRGGDTSLETRAQARYQDYAKSIDNRAQKGSYWGLMQNPAEQRDLFLSIFGKDTGNPEHAEFGRAVREAIERARQDAVDVGIPIHALDDYMPRAWAWEKIAADREQFIKDALANIDPRDYVHPDGTRMTPAELREFVAAATDTLASNGSNKRGDAIPQKGVPGVGGRHNAPRQLSFKSPEAELFMQEKYGAANNVMSLLQQHLRRVAHDTSVAETFTTHADEFVPQLIHKAFDNDNKAQLTDAERAKLARLRDFTLRAWEAFRRPGSGGALPLWARISTTIRGVVANSLLGGQLFSSLPDNAMLNTYGLHIGLTRRQLIGNKLEGASLNPETVAFVRRLGLVRDIIENGTDRFGAGELDTQAVRFMNHKMHVLSAMRWFDRSQIHGISASIMDIWGEHVTKTPFDELKPSDAKYLTDRGITPAMYEVWRMADLERGPQGNHQMLTADGINAIPDAKLRALAEQQLAEQGSKKFSQADVERQIRRLRSEAANRFMSMVLADTNIAARGASGNSLRDNLALHITQDNADTVIGQVMRWLLLLKQTPLGIFRTHMIDVPHGMDGWKSRALYRAQYVARGIAWGAATVALKSILQGNDPENIASMKGLAKIAIASGGGGMYGDFLFGDTAEGARHGYVHNGLVKLAGPGASMFSDAYDLFARSKAELGGYDGRPGTYSAKWAKFIHDYGVPFGRLWYIKAAQNHLIYQRLMDELNPGYSARIRQRMMQNRQSSWWKPGTTTPQRAPDLTKIASGE